MELLYIKTDKNGTKIYHDWDCPRCGGAGQSENWWQTGRICYKCGGTGKRATPKVVKMYTPEYQAKLDEKARVRREAATDKKKTEGYIPALKRFGFCEDGVGYVYTGNTYAIKGELSRGGAKFSYALHWVSPKPISDFPCVEIHADEVVQWFDGGDRYDLSNPKCEAWREAHNIVW